MKKVLVMIMVIIAALIALTSKISGDLTATQYDEMVRIENQYAADKAAYGEVAAWHLRQR